MALRRGELKAIGDLQSSAQQFFIGQISRDHMPKIQCMYPISIFLSFSISNITSPRSKSAQSYNNCESSLLCLARGTVYILTPKRPSRFIPPHFAIALET